LLPLLEKEGYRCVTVNLPSTQFIDTPPQDLAADTAAVRNSVITELDAGNDVVVVAHSYGGCPSNNALKDLDRKSRSTSGARTAVTALIFLCAIPLPVGSTFLGALGGKPHPVHDFTRSKDFADVGAPGAGHWFYNNLTPEQVDRYSGMLRSQAWIAYEQETTYAAFVDVPSWYLFTELDQVLPIQYQQGIVAAAEGAGAKVKTWTVRSSHSPFLSMPEKTAQLIIEAASTAT
jgi:pimeloyl-ACP methyl ester carboxylesterase